MRVGFRVDAGERIGGGHLMRCLALADELRTRGAQVVFVCGGAPPALVDRIERARHCYRSIQRHADIDRSGDDWHEPPLGAEVQQLDAELTKAALGGSVDWLVVDHYLFDAAWHRAARIFAGQILVIDELANRALDCDLLADQALGHSAADDRAIVPPNARVLAGGSYALLRPEFAHERPIALRRRREIGHAGRVLISLGTSDVGQLTAPAVEALLETAPSCALDVVLGPAAASRIQVEALARANPRITVHVDSRNMAVLMRDADFAIGAAGTTSWERCCLGLPSAVFVLAENQRATARALEETGAAVLLADPDELRSKISSLLANAGQLEIMSAAAFALTDGLGTTRVADAMLGLGASASRDMSFRAANANDAEMLWLWRNDPVTRAASRSQHAISWPDHMRWFEAVTADPHRRLWVAESCTEPVGMVRFDADPDDPRTWEVSINLRPDARGAGLGKAVLSAACDEFASQTESERLLAQVRTGNAASRRLFESCGFGRIGPADDRGFTTYALNKAVRPHAAQGSRA